MIAVFRRFGRSRILLAVHLDALEDVFHVLREGLFVRVVVAVGHDAGDLLTFGFLGLVGVVFPVIEDGLVRGVSNFGPLGAVVFGVVVGRWIFLFARVLELADVLGQTRENVCGAEIGFCQLEFVSFGGCFLNDGQSLLCGDW